MKIVDYIKCMNRFTLTPSFATIMLCLCFVTCPRAVPRSKLSEKTSISGIYLKAFMAVSERQSFKKGIGKRLNNYEINFYSDQDSYFVDFFPIGKNLVGNELIYVIRKRDFRVIKEVGLQ